MKLVRSQQGLTLIELLIAMAISAVLIGVLAPSILQTTEVTTSSSTRVTALEDIKTVAYPITFDVRMAQTTDPAAEELATNTLILDWTSWYNDTGELGPVDHRCKYTLLQGQGKVQREYWEHPREEGEVYPDYWENYVQTNPDPSPTTFGRHISGIEFSRHRVPEGSSYIQVVITSSPENRAETEEQLTYYVNLRPMEDPVQ